eukprot:scaffold212572_cov23-Tisochrysis_lutea.AAC.1
MEPEDRVFGGGGCARLSSLGIKETRYNEWLLSMNTTSIIYNFPTLHAHTPFGTKAARAFLRMQIAYHTHTPTTSLLHT